MMTVITEMVRTEKEDLINLTAETVTATTKAEVTIIAKGTTTIRNERITTTEVTETIKEEIITTAAKEATEATKGEVTMIAAKETTEIQDNLIRMTTRGRTTTKDRTTIGDRMIIKDRMTINAPTTISGPTIVPTKAEQKNADPE